MIANHQSFLDPVLLAAFVPDRLTFAINTYIAKNRIVKYLHPALRDLSHGSRQPLRHALAHRVRQRPEENGHLSRRKDYGDRIPDEGLRGAGHGRRQVRRYGASGAHRGGPVQLLLTVARQSQAEAVSKNPPSLHGAPPAAGSRGSEGTAPPANRGAHAARSHDRHDLRDQ